MKKINSHSRSGLFLMEMTLSLLVLSLTAAVCVRIFAAARTCRQEAREWNHIQELTTSAGEILEGTNGSPRSFLALLPDGTVTGNSISYYYDRQWNSCSVEEASYQMNVALHTEAGQKQADLQFLNHQGTPLYEQTIRFPFNDFGKGDH